MDRRGRAKVVLFLCVLVLLCLEVPFAKKLFRMLGVKSQRTIKGDAQFLHTLPFVVDYFGTVAKIKEQNKPPAEEKGKTQLYCTEIDLYDQTKVILTGYNFFVWRKMSVIEFDFLKTTCFDRENHTLYVLQPNLFKVISNFTYIDDLELKIKQLPKEEIRKPLIHSYYLILNGNDQQMRKMASQLFGFDVLSLTSEEFIPYHQLLWFMSAILPYEKHRIFGRPFIVLSDREDLIKQSTLHFLNSLLPYLNKKMVPGQVTYNYNPDQKRVCSRNSALIGFPLTFRITQQSWITLRTLRLHVLSRMGLSVCYSKTDHIRVRITTNARMHLMRSDRLFWTQASEDPKLNITALNPNQVPIYDTISTVQRTDVFIISVKDLIFNFIFLRTNSVLVVLDDQPDELWAQHRAYRRMMEELTVKYEVLDQRNQSLLLNGGLLSFVDMYASFISGKYADDLKYFPVCWF